MRLTSGVAIAALVTVAGVGGCLYWSFRAKNAVSKPNPVADIRSPAAYQAGSWMAPSDSSIPAGSEGAAIRYGRELIVHTSHYLGPHGTVGSISNGMNCQNCHLDAGTRPYGLNYSTVAATYPQFKARSNSFVTIADRVNGCLQRSLNGTALDTNSKEMQSIVAYLKWVGGNVSDEKHIFGALRNISNAMNDPRLKGKLTVELICFGDGVAVYQKDGQFKEKLQQLKNDGVILAQCENTVRERHIDKNTLVDFISYVPSGNGEIIIREHQGWATVHP